MINYPTGNIKRYTKKIDHSKRGMHLEEDINTTNKYYLEENKAVIYKKPTPIQVVRVENAVRSKALIKEAFYQVPSTTDYNGIYKGKYIDFEAKETNNKTSFPLNNIHKHQLEHLISIYKHGGISFLIIRFNLLNKTFLYKSEDLINWLSNNNSSIPISELNEKGYVINESYIPRLDYLKAVDEAYFKE